MDNFELAKHNFFKGIICLENQNFSEAEFHFLESLKLAPNRVSTLTNLSAVQFKLKKYSEARFTANQALGLDPKNSEAYLNLGLIEKDLGHFSNSLEFLDKAIALNKSIEALINQGAVLNELERYEEALVAHKNAIDLDPKSAKAWSNQGVSLNGLRLYEEALVAHKNAIDLDPKSAKAWSNQGISLNELGQYEQALMSYFKALELDPKEYNASWNLSLTQLLLEDFSSGWLNYENRWKKDNSVTYRHGNLKPLESLDSIAGKSVLVWAEQGYGDTIQFSRYIKVLANLGIDIVFEVQPPLKTLMSNSFKFCTVISQGELIKKSIDYQIPLMSLPLLFKTTAQTIPNFSPYVSPSMEKLIFWKNHLDLSKQGLNIGISFSGSPTHKNDVVRSINPKYLAPLKQIGKIFVVQKGMTTSNVNFLNSHPEITNLDQKINSFDDTAAILESMDLVVSVDTSLAHLAGALNKQTYLLLPKNPEWRWGLDKKYSIWYDSLRLVRQPSTGDWQSCIDLITSELISLNI